jgi:2,4-dienoyl-CoA reductase-like NADH-dependent reductase (Old Yellow Enzyme family)
VSLLFSPITLRGLTLRNRVIVSPMCMYSTPEGIPGPWHLVHLGSRAIGGAGAVMAEASAVSREGRISPMDLGIWSDAHTEAFKPIVQFIRESGAVAAIQLAHAGRKASTAVPWLGHKPIYEEANGWLPLGPSPIPYADGYAPPREMSLADIDKVVADFAAAARRAHAAGFELLECHMGHGYLLHSFLSPISNQRTDEYGGSLENRARLPLRVARAVREAWPESLPLFVRISSTDWIEGGWDLPQSVQLSRWMKEIGVDLMDCSSGAVNAASSVPAAPGFHVPFSSAIRQQAGIATGAVGLITEAVQAEQIVGTGLADVILIGRGFLEDPYWALHAARKLRAEGAWPLPYARAVGVRRST